MQSIMKLRSAAYAAKRVVARSIVRTKSTKVDSFLGGSNSVYVEQMYAAWSKDPASVHTSWHSYFSNVESGLESEHSFVAPPSVSGSVGSQASAPAARAGNQASSDSLGLSYLIRAYQVRGHEIANLDPLGQFAWRDTDSHIKELDYEYHGFTEADLDRKLDLLSSSTGGNTGFLDVLGTKPVLSLREVIDNLKRTYCSGLGVEYMHMGSQTKCNWIRDQVEHPKWMQFTKEKKMHIYERLAFADHFEKFLGNKFNTAKRFGLEGGDSVIPGLKCMIDRGSELGIESFIFGMPHRGRLNTLANVMRKPMPQIFKEFQGTHYDLDEYMKEDWSSAGDVKYHLGTSMDRSYPDGRRVHMSLVANPSHLEAVNPVVIGKVRAKQFFSGNREEDKMKHMPVLLHGDAAFAGQGVVYETMQMAKVPDFAVGGTIHVIVNNQVGFTTDPRNGRSTMYASDLGKAFNIPIFHCNGDDPLAVCTAFEMAVEWRQQFGEDCIIDMICYRRYGHNELDQPMYTQPKMYQEILKHPDALDIYGDQLKEAGTVTDAELTEVKAMVNATLEAEFEASKSWETPANDWLASRWSGYLSPLQQSRIRETGVPIETLRDIGMKIATIPESVKPHKQMAKIFKARQKSIETGEGIDWGTAEALAFGTLLIEGNHVRLTGQDVQRGTFSHRHASVCDQETGDFYTPLNNIAKHVSPSTPLSVLKAPDIQAEFVARNSILSEFGVLGFEMGYSLENPNTLILWEAQFGDFVNGAQVMIDQFISAGEDKWLRQSGLVMLLPHGYMGQGAEHSSCRVERFLQQVDEDPDVIPAMHADERRQIQMTNWQVVNCTTPANYYHVLRRQVHRDFRKPLIVVAPKNLLRDKRCTSTLDDMGGDTRFLRTIGEHDEKILANPEKVRRVVYCTGKVYFELDEHRTKHGIDDVAIVRVEQLAPFPWDKVREEIERYPNAKHMWTQEEPKNMGAWSFVQPRFDTLMEDVSGELVPREARLTYVGRSPAAATATGLGARAHNAEQEKIMVESFGEKEGAH
jgi:2-oxoglutarate dehydrogenase E1 component